jgi:hypothetical protein
MEALAIAAGEYFSGRSLETKDRDHLGFLHFVKHAPHEESGNSYSFRRWFS